MNIILIDTDKLDFHCNYEGDCTGDKESCKECDNYVLDYRDLCNLSSYNLDRIIMALKMDSSVKLYGSQNSDNYLIPLNRAIEIVKSGGGIKC